MSVVFFPFPETYSPELEVDNIPGNGFVKVRWIVSGRGTPKITVDSAKGGVVTK